MDLNGIKQNLNGMTKEDLSLARLKREFLKHWNNYLGKCKDISMIFHKGHWPFRINPRNSQPVQRSKAKVHLSSQPKALEEHSYIGRPSEYEETCRHEITAVWSDLTQKRVYVDFPNTQDIK